MNIDRNNLIQPIKQLGELIEQIEKFNSDFGRASGFANFMASLLTASMSVETSKPKNEKDPIKEAEETHRKFSSFLYQTGLELQLNRGKQEVEQLKHELNVAFKPEDDSVTTIKNNRLDLEIVDLNKVVNFLSGITVSEAADSRAQQTLRALASSIDDIMIHRHMCIQLGLLVANTDNESLKNAATDIYSEFNRLGLKDKAQELRNTLDHLLSGTLSEYLFAKENNILPSYGFTPANWHLDNTSESYQDKWDKALDCYFNIRNVPAALALSQQSQEYLLKCANDAMNYIESKLAEVEKGSYWDDYGMAMSETLKVVIQRLNHN